ncbi:MAG: DUF2188 domain-containing protein [Candidatus Thermoplasmatota archaeon]|nr:DUF2188 domain-containing protein [Candidatus Thermoplasmatota archaeon]
MSKDNNMPVGISIFLVLFLIFEIYYFFFDYLFAGLYPFHGYSLDSLGYIPYLVVTVFLYAVVVFCLYKITAGIILREDWARKFTILYAIWASIWPLWAIIIGNRLYENIIFFVIYVIVILYLLSSYVKKYFEKSRVFTYGPYTLYTRKVDLRNTGKLVDIYYFCSHTPKSGTPCAMPKGYEVGVNPRTKMPYLQKIGNVQKTEMVQTQEIVQEPDMIKTQEIVQEPEIYKYGVYTLYTRKVKLENADKEIDIFFFSSHEPKSGTPCSMPEGYEVGVNARTKLPYLKKTGNKTVKTIEAPKEQVETVNKKPSNVVYVVSKPSEVKGKGDWAVRTHGKIFSSHRTQENAIKAASVLAKKRNATVMIQSTSGAFREGFKPKK